MNKRSVIEEQILLILLILSTIHEINDLMLCMKKKKSIDIRTKISEFCLELPNAIFNYNN